MKQAGRNTIGRPAGGAKPRLARIIRRIMPAGFGRCGFILAAVLLGLPGFAQSDSQPAGAVKSPLSNRWLFIVETSKHMAPMADAVERMTASLVAAGMNDQMRRGDTVGLWTFNEDLFTGRYSLQVWTPGTCQTVALDLYNFLKDQKYEKSSHLDKVMAPMQQIIKSSDFITVLLLSDGREQIQGTPFDEKINTFYQTWEKQSEKTHIPFVAVLRAEHGQIMSYTVTLPPWSLELPPLPHELTDPPVVNPALKPQNLQPSPVPPLIIHGNKPAPPPTEQTSGSTVSNQTIIQAPPPSPAPQTPAAFVTPPTLAEPVSKPESPAAAEAVNAGKVEAAVPVPEPQVAVAIPSSQNTNATAAETATHVPGTNGLLQAGVPAGPVPAAEVASPDIFWSRKMVWIPALTLLVLTLGIVFLMVRRAQAPMRVSLVTHPPDQEKK